MSCSAPLFDKWLHKLGYKSACILHDNDYYEAKSYRHKLKSDISFMHNFYAFVPKFYSRILGLISLIILTINPFSYYLYFKNQHNLVGHLWAGFWIVGSVYQIAGYLI